MTIGNLMATHSVKTRIKYGRFPAVERTWDPTTKTILEEACSPLEGHEEDVIEPLPDFEAMSPAERMMTALNRKDFRERVRKFLPRPTRKYAYTQDLHARVNRGWEPDIDANDSPA